MTRSNLTRWIAAVTTVVAFGGGAWVYISTPDGEELAITAKDDMPRYRAGAFDVGVMTDPRTPKVEVRPRFM